MNGNDGSGCAWAMLLSLVLVVVVGIAVSMTGLPTWDGSLAWDTTATADRQVTERLAIVEGNQTERLRIAESADTQRTWAIALASVAVIGLSVYGTVRIVQANAKRQPATVVYQIPAHVVEVARRLPAQDAYRPEQVDGQWLLISDVRNDWMTVDDAHRLTG